MVNATAPSLLLVQTMDLPTSQESVLSLSHPIKAKLCIRLPDHLISVGLLVHYFSNVGGKRRGVCSAGVRTVLLARTAAGAYNTVGGRLVRAMPTELNVNSLATTIRVEESDV